jgi:ethanolamine utilization protein EutA
MSTSEYEHGQSLAHQHDESSLISVSREGVEEMQGLEMFKINSVGIDIGSSTSHLIFSQLTLRRGAADSRFKVTDRQVIYRSSIMLTPYLSGTFIDAPRIEQFIRQAYQGARFTPEDIDTGAVVITGEALKKENAQPITELFAKEAGKFICASAGPNHEALLAAYGCGAVALSHAEQATVLNIDMGGGTTKLSLIRRGVVVGTSAISVGARLLAFDDSNMVTRLETPGKLMLQHLGSSLELASPISEEEKEAIAGLMAETLIEVVQGKDLSKLTTDLLVTAPLKNYSGATEVDLVVFSGGVSEYIYQHEASSHGDLGPQLGRQVRERLFDVFRADAVREPAEGIRATVIGACEYTVQASGTTCHLSGAAALPAYSLQVVRPTPEEGETLEEATLKALSKFDLTEFGRGLALALTMDGELNYQTLRRVAESIWAVVDWSEDASAPLFIVLDTDVAKSLGGILKEELDLERELVVVDGIDVGDLDYLDIGRPMGVSEVVPVTVKSLVFHHNL